MSEKKTAEKNTGEEEPAEVTERTREILRRLDQAYGTDVMVSLDYQTDWQFLTAVILSAQCTDARVNIVTKDLFRKYDTIEKLAGADQKELEDDIHSVGFYHNKARNIILCMRRILTEYGGKVPSALEDLLTLAGVGRKTANVIRGNVFHDPSIVVDTHVKRISRRLGLTENTDPKKVEFDLMKVLPKEHWIRYNMQIITLGRTICTARSPKCSECFLADLCSSEDKR